MHTIILFLVLFLTPIQTMRLSLFLLLFLTLLLSLPLILFQRLLFTCFSHGSLSSSCSSFPCFSSGYLLYLLLHSVLDISFSSPKFCSSTYSQGLLLFLILHLTFLILYLTFSLLLSFLISLLCQRHRWTFCPRGVNDCSSPLLFATISRNIRTKLNRSSWTREKMIHERNLKSCDTLPLGFITIRNKLYKS
jgi:hypothetical protein